MDLRGYTRSFTYITNEPAIIQVKGQPQRDRIVWVWCCNTCFCLVEQEKTTAHTTHHETMADILKMMNHRIG